MVEIILFLYVVCIAWIIYYFFIDKQNKADREYDEKIRKIYYEQKPYRPR